MPQPTSSAALKTTRPRMTANAARQRFTNRPTPTVDLDAATEAWAPFAEPGEPQPCGLIWCRNCYDQPEGALSPAYFHHTATAVIQYRSHNGVDSAVEDTGTLRIDVERFDPREPSFANEPAEVFLELSGVRALDMSPAQAERLAEAVRKAVAGAARLAERPGATDGTTGVVNVLRFETCALHVGAVVVVDGEATACVFLNVVPDATAGAVRKAARSVGMRYDTPDTWDLWPSDALKLADTLLAASVLAAADRAGAEVSDVA